MLSIRRTWTPAECKCGCRCEFTYNYDLYYQLGFDPCIFILSNNFTINRRSWRRESPFPILGADRACLDSVESTGLCDMYIKNRAFQSNFAKIVITEFLLCGLSDLIFTSIYQS